MEHWLTLMRSFTFVCQFDCSKTSRQSCYLIMPVFMEVWSTEWESTLIHCKINCTDYNSCRLEAEDRTWSDGTDDTETVLTHWPIDHDLSPRLWQYLSTSSSNNLNNAREPDQTVRNDENIIFVVLVVSY